MRLLRIRATGFGPLRDLDTGEGTPLPSLVAVHGPNEAGKSSFHQAVVALLHGFYPATRDTNPLAPWSGESPELRGWIETAGSQRLEVHRRLLSRPDGTLTRGDRVEQIRNHALPQLAHVSRGVYEQVYALTLGELAGLSGDGWDAVQDRLVVGMGTSDLRAPREVVAGLEGRAASLWRPDRRGKPRFAELRAELEGLREARRAAVERDRELRALHRTLEEGEASMAEARTRREALEEKRARIARLGPLAQRLRHLDELAGAVGDEAELVGVPVDPAAALASLDERAEEWQGRNRRLAAELEEAEGRAAEPEEELRALAEHERDLRALADRAPVLQERAAARGRIEAELVEQDRRVLGAAGHLFEGEAPTAEALSSVPLPRIRTALGELERSERRLEQARDALREVERRPGKASSEPFPAAPAAAFGIGTFALATGFLPGATGGNFRPWLPLVVLAGALLAAWGGVRLARWKARGELAVEGARAREREAGATQERIQELEAEHARRADEVARLLDPLPLRSEVRERSDPALAGELERVRDLVLDRAARARVRDRLVDEDRALATQLERVRGEAAGLDDLPPDPVVALPELGRRLDDALRRREAARAAARECERIRTELAEVDRELATVEARRSNLESAIRRAGGDEGSLDAAVSAAVRRLRSREALERGWAELRQERGALDNERAEVARAESEGADWLRDPGALDRIDRELRDLYEESETLSGTVEAARERARALEGEETADLVDGRILAVEEEMARVRRERDRLHVLARLVAVAEKRFREDHQPDLLRRAGAYLERITDGRYTRLLLGDEPGGAPFLLDAEHLPGPRPVGEPISTGTREQTWLALRLAIVDHLDRDREPLPLFLDEVLVNWDRERRGRGLDLLAEAAKVRQVFVFTCHADLAEAIEERGGRVIELAAPRQVG